jgi:putative transcriptional regulator
MRDTSPFEGRLLSGATHRIFGRRGISPHGLSSDFRYKASLPPPLIIATAMRIRSIGLALLALLWAMAPSAPVSMAQADSLAGQLLVASPEIGDPRFAHAVILVLRHKLSGAVGIVINRPIEERTFASLLQAIGDDASDVEGRVLLFAGGPVEPQVGFVLHSSDYHRDETMDVAAQVGVTSSRDIIRDIAHKKGPEKALIAFGYAGWGPGQLESEMTENSWFVAPADPKLIFDDDRATVWQDAMAHRRRTL